MLNGMDWELKSSVYRRAAQLLEEGKECLCCRAIDSAVEEVEALSTAHIKAFASYFRPNNAWGIWWESTAPKNQTARTLALLFMAEILEREQ